MSPIWLKHIYSVLCALTWKPMPAATRSRLYSRVMYCTCRNSLEFRNVLCCNMLTFDPAINQETGASGRYHLDLWTGWNQCNCNTHRKQVGVKQWYNPVPQTVWELEWVAVEVQVAVRGSENQLLAEGLGPQHHQLSSPAEWKSAA